VIYDAPTAYDAATPYDAEPVVTLTLHGRVTSVDIDPDPSGATVTVRVEHVG
jgi:hypothetical protein